MSEIAANPADHPIETSEEIFIPKFCPRCHYNLKGIAAEGKRTPSNDATDCPECGFDFSKDLRQYTIPWMREDIFPPFKFLRTVLFILFKPGRTRYNLFLELDTSKAKRFNLYSLILLILTWYAVFATTTFHYRLDYIDGGEQHIDLVIGANIGCLIGLILMVPLLIDSPLWFCRKSENLKNIRCLGQFSSSPLLLWSPLLAIILISFFGEMMAYWDFDDHMNLHGFGVQVPFLVAMLYFWLLALRLVKASGRGIIATCAIMAALPVIWAAILFIAFVAVPYLFYAMAIMVLTF